MLILKKIKNSFFHFPFLWGMVISESDYDNTENGQKPPALKRLLIRLIWFWPRLYHDRIWVNEKFDPTPYSEIDDKAEILTSLVAAQAAGKDEKILDICCSCARHLHLLASKGFTSLHGFDINPVAIESAPSIFPNLKNIADLTASSAQRFLLRAPDKYYGITFTRGATIELIHPSFPVVREICRITQNSVVILLYDDHAYPLFWEWEFRRSGFYLQNKTYLEESVFLLLFKRFKVS